VLLVLDGKVVCFVRVVYVAWFWWCRGVLGYFVQVVVFMIGCVLCSYFIVCWFSIQMWSGGVFYVGLLWVLVLVLFV